MANLEVPEQRKGSTEVIAQVQLQIEHNHVKRCMGGAALRFTQAVAAITSDTRPVLSVVSCQSTRACQQCQQNACNGGGAAKALCTGAELCKQRHGKAKRKMTKCLVYVCTYVHVMKPNVVQHVVRGRAVGRTHM